MTEIAGLIEIITSKEPQTIEGECHQHTDEQFSTGRDLRREARICSN
jgi:hypothetical protein